MILRNHIKVFLFLSSFIPLFGIIIIRNLDAIPIVVGFGSLIAIVSIVLAIMFFQVSRISGKYLNIDRVENANKVSLEYFVVYIVPFLTVDFLALTDLASMAILFGIMAYMYVKSDLIYMNPMLNLFRLNIFKVRLQDGEEVIVISKRKKKDLATEEVIELAENVLIGRDNWPSLSSK